MQVTVEESSGLNRTLKVQIPEDTIKQSVDQRIRTLGSKARIPGFRPGKVPQKLIRERYGDQARQEVISDLLKSSFRDALTEKDLVPAGTPEITEMHADSGNGLEYTASFEVFPELELKPCSELELKHSDCEITSDDVDVMIEKLREQNRQWNTVDRASKEGDRVNIKYTYKADTEDESVKQGSSDSVWVLVGQPSLMPEFDEKVNNVSKDEHLDFSVTFPEDYNHPGLAGKKADFELDVLAVEEPSLPDVDEEFIQKFGVEEGTLEAFREELLSNLEREKKSALKQRQKSDVMQALYDNNPVVVPQVMVDAELKELLKPYQEAVDKKNAVLDDADLEKQLAEEAKRRVSLSLILGDIIKRNNLQPDPERIKQTIEEIAAGYEDPNALMEWYLSDQERLQQIQQSVLEDQAIEWVMEQAQIVDQSLTFSELMGVESNAG
ncbi:MAG TPA: trigger factor [Crenotrichaceae bacterium]|nr:trigger factor [Crenotrichaceae bacterium]